MINSTKCKYQKTIFNSLFEDLKRTNSSKKEEPVIALSQKIFASYPKEDDLLKSKATTLPERVQKLNQLAQIQQGVASEVQKLRILHKTAPATHKPAYISVAYTLQNDTNYGYEIGRQEEAIQRALKGEDPTRAQPKPCGSC